MSDDNGDFKILKVTTADVDELRRRTMGLDVKKFPLPEALAVTNERLLAVRDDLMQFVNAQNGSLARVIRADVERALSAVARVNAAQDLRHSQVLQAFERLREDFIVRQIHRCRRCRKKQHRRRKSS